MKYKIGNKLKIISRKHSHEFKINEIVEVMYVGETYYYCKRVIENVCHLENHIVENDEVELIDVDRLQMLELESIL